MAFHTRHHLESICAVARLDRAAPFSAWADGVGFMLIARPDDELSIVFEKWRGDFCRIAPRW